LHGSDTFKRQDPSLTAAKFIVLDYENKVDSGKYFPFRDYEFGYSSQPEAL